MAEGGFEPWEPEETIGKIWHAFANGLQAPAAHDAHAVALQDVETRLGVFYRGLGGAAATEIKATPPQESHHRLSFRRQLGTYKDKVARPSFDGESLRLPEVIADFPNRETNAALYFWLTASVANAPDPVADADPLAADIRSLIQAAEMTRRTLQECPGLRALYTTLVRASRETRPSISLPRTEQSVHLAIDHLLGGPIPTDARAREFLTLIRTPDADLTSLHAPARYRPYRPVPLWPDLRPAAARLKFERLAEAEETGGEQGADAGIKKARRSESDQAERRDSLILHRFESIFSWVESLNMNRRIEDDDDETARKAADDQEELALGQVSKKTATRLKFDLDLAPEDVDREKVSGKHIYPEWDYKAGGYIADHCNVLASSAPMAETAPAFNTDPSARRRIRAVKRQFEALRPKRIILPRQLDGDDLDIEAAIAAQVELRATGQSSDRVYRATRVQERDLAVSILMDTSRSTESHLGERMVIDVEKEALAALAWGLEACGDDCAINTFSSLRRDRVYLLNCKEFEEKMGTAVEARIEGLRPGFYTRLGAAIRHASAELAKRPNSKRLLLVITDGKPNDLDHYEGRHGIEDSRMAIREARRKGQSVHGVVIEAKGQAWFNRIFGNGGFSVVSDPEKLTSALPEIYRQITGGA